MVEEGHLERPQGWDWENCFEIVKTENE